MLEEESGNWSPTPGLGLFLVGNRLSLPGGKLHGEWQAPVLQQGLEDLPLAGPWLWSAGTILPTRRLPVSWPDLVELS